MSSTQARDTDTGHDYPTKPAVSLEVLHPVAVDAVRVTATDRDGRRWHLDVTRTGEYDVVASWNSQGELADVAVPEDVERELRGLQ